MRRVDIYGKRGEGRPLGFDRQKLGKFGLYTKKISMRTGNDLIRSVFFQETTCG